MSFLFEVETCKQTSKIALCGECELKHAHHKGLGNEVVGKGGKGILILFSHPETCEDSEGVLWQTDETHSGILLNAVKTALSSSGLDLEEDCWRVDAVGCSPRYIDRKYLSDAVRCCQPNLEATLKALKPRVIIPIDGGAVQALYANRCASEITMLIESWHGFVIPDFTMNAWVIPCYGPSFLSEHYKQNKDGTYKQMETAKLVLREIIHVGEKALKYADEDRDAPPDNFKKAMKRVVVHKDDTTSAGDPFSVIVYLRKIKSGDTISFDYEATSIKPDSKDNYTYCVSIYCERLDESHSFMIDNRDVNEELLTEYKRIMADKQIKKVGQNVKMEHRWTHKKFKTKVKGWIWDTMLTSHYLYSNRLKVTGLKFQTGVNFGIFHYNANVENLLRTPIGDNNRGGNTTNSIEKANKEDVLTYCALDSLFTFWLYKRQVKILNKWHTSLLDAVSCQDGNKFLLTSALTYCDMEKAGAFIDKDYLEKQKKACGEKCETLLQQFRKTELFKLWKKEFGDKANPMSGKQLSTILYGVMGLKQKKKTESGEDSTDKEALLSLGIADLVPLSDAKLLSKAEGTYINSITRELVGNFVHTSLNIHIVRSFRGSSDSPNLQNTPIRNKQIGIIIRGAFISRFGKNGVITEADLKGAEVSASACYHKDKKFMSYVSDPRNDMHKDTMGLILSAPPTLVSKELRHIAKNMFVFPEFYGDWYKSCTEGIWQEMQKLKMTNGQSAMQWLHDHKILTLPKMWKEGDYLIQEHHPAPYAQFEEHMKDVEHHFWYEMFPEYTEWKNEWFQKYLVTGFVESLTGFRYTGILNRKQTINYPIQGTAYHLNQTGANLMNRWLPKQSLDTVLFNQIHDSQLYDHPNLDEARVVISQINHTMNVILRQMYPWINVPIVVEFEVTEPGMSWFHKKPFDLKTMDYVKKE